MFFGSIRVVALVERRVNSGVGLLKPMGELKDKLLRLTSLRYQKLPLLFENMREMTTVNDPVLQILKCHLVSEALLDALIEFAFEPNGSAVLSARLSYHAKLTIASRSVLADDWPLLPDFVVGSLRKLNSLRNRMAHQLGATVSLEEILELFAGVNHLMPITPSEDNISLVIYHYTSFIFGNMLPKYEAIEPDI
jgi:hypothetical protein